MIRTRTTISLLAFLAVVATALVGLPQAAQGGDRNPCTLEAPCFVHTPAGKMAYIEALPSRRHTATVILLHGFTDSKRSWSLSMEALQEQNPHLRIIAIDQRGHGQSFRPKTQECRDEPALCFTPKLMADDLAGFMDTLGIESAYVAGHSMGSVVAQFFAKRHPDRTDGAVLVATAANLRDNYVLTDWLLDDVILGTWKPAIEAKGYAWPGDTYRVDALDADPNAVEWMKVNWDVDPIAPLWFTDTISEETARVRLQTWLGVAEDLSTLDNVKKLSRTTPNMLVLWGIQDTFFSMADQEVVVDALETAATRGGSFCWKQYGILPLGPSGYQTDDLGHNLQWEAPAQVARDIDSFIRTGLPTDDLFHTDAPEDIQRIVTVRGAAEVLCG